MATALYGTALYGVPLYGGQAYSWEYRIEHWRGSAMVQRLDPLLRTGSWEYIRFTGCGRGDFALAMDYDRAGEFMADDEIRVYCRDEVGPGYTLFYRGLLTAMEPELGVYDTIRLSTMGYKLYLDRITIDRTYTATEISLIVKNILDTDVVPNSRITYVGADLDATSFTPDSVTFLSTAAEAIDLLAKLGSMMEYGVDKDGKFFFRTPSTTVGFRFPFEKDVTDAREMLDYEKIVNRAIVRGAGSTKQTRNDAASQAKYGIRAAILHNTAATTNAMANQYGDAILADQAEADLRSTITLAANRAMIESVRPVKRVTMLKAPLAYGAPLYGAAKYQGDYQYKISRIQYVITELGLQTTLELGRSRPRLADTIFQLASNIRAARPT